MFATVVSRESFDKFVAASVCRKHGMTRQRDNTFLRKMPDSSERIYKYNVSTQNTLQELYLWLNAMIQLSSICDNTAKKIKKKTGEKVQVKNFDIQEFMRNYYLKFFLSDIRRRVKTSKKNILYI